MKKQFALTFLIIAMLFALVSCKNKTADNQQDEVPLESSEDVIGWELKYYVDDFKEETDKWYITSEEGFVGTFNNSATEDSDLVTVMLIDEENLSIFLYEYGHSQVKNSWYDRNIEYNIKMRLPDKSEHTVAGLMQSEKKGGDRIFAKTSVDKSFIIDALLGEYGTGDIKFVVECKDNAFEKYYFTAQTSDFAEVYAEACQ